MTLRFKPLTTADPRDLRVYEVRDEAGTLLGTVERSQVSNGDPWAAFGLDRRLRGSGITRGAAAGQLAACAADEDGAP